VMADFFGLVGLVLFLAFNGHLVLIGALVKSFAVIPVAVGGTIHAAGWGALANAGAMLFEIGVFLALPVVAVVLTMHLAVGTLSRAAPQVNLMSVGFALFLWVGIAATVTLVPFFPPAVEPMIDTSNEDKTEQPTPRRLVRAREEGSIARAPGLPGAAIMVTAALFFLMGGRSILGSMEQSLRLGLGLDAATMREPERVFVTAWHVMSPPLAATSVLILLIMVVGVLSNLAVGGWVFAPKLLMPDVNRINPLSGLRRLFSREGLAEIVKALLKVCVIGAVTYVVVRDSIPGVANLARESWPAAALGVAAQTSRALLYFAGALAFVGALEVPYQLW